MAYICVFFTTVIVSTRATNMMPSMVGHVYNRMDYNASGVTLAKLASSSRFHCAAQCANQWLTCRTAVYDSSVLPACRLFSETVISSRLLVSSNAVVYDFQQSKSQVITKVFRWNKTGITVAGASLGTPGVSANMLFAPYGLAFDASKALYIADYRNNRIQKWFLNASNGTTVAGRADGISGASSTALSSPGFVLVDSSMNIFLTDRLNHRVMYWVNGAGWGTTIAGVTGVSGSSNSTLNLPGALARDSSSDALYVADASNHRIMRFASNATSGTVVAGGNGAGNGVTQLNTPNGFTFDSATNSLLIANYDAHNVVRWVLGASSWTLVVGSMSAVSGSTSMLLYQPTCVALDPMGNVYVVDAGNHRVQFFLNGQSNGTTIAGVTGSLGATATQLTYPVWLIFDDDLNLYVSDSVNNRIQMFRYY